MPHPLLSALQMARGLHNRPESGVADARGIYLLLLRQASISLLR
jgi:hypothetical protein